MRSDRKCGMTELFAPTVTSPVVVFATLLNVLVAPSATICAREMGAAINMTARKIGEVFMVGAFVLQVQSTRVPFGHSSVAGQA